LINPNSELFFRAASSFLSVDLGGEEVVDVGEAEEVFGAELSAGDLSIFAVADQGASGDVEDVADVVCFQPFVAGNEGLPELLFEPVEALRDLTDGVFVFDSGGCFHVLLILISCLLLLIGFGGERLTQKGDFFSTIFHFFLFSERISRIPYLETKRGHAEARPFFNWSN